MPDSKKVIEGLKKAAEELARYAPMKVNGRCQMYFDGAIHLLKEQEAVKPFVGNYWKNSMGRCGHCKTPLPALEGLRSKFCWMCGRKVKWDD